MPRLVLGAVRMHLESARPDMDSLNHSRPSEAQRHTTARCRAVVRDAPGTSWALLLSSIGARVQARLVSMLLATEFGAGENVAVRDPARLPAAIKVS